MCNDNVLRSLLSWSLGLRLLFLHLSFLERTTYYTPVAPLSWDGAVKRIKTFTQHMIGQSFCKINRVDFSAPLSLESTRRSFFPAKRCWAKRTTEQERIFGRTCILCGVFSCWKNDGELWNVLNVWLGGWHSRNVASFVPGGGGMRMLSPLFHFVFLPFGK